MNSSCNSLSSEPLSLLESLYEREHSCTIDKDDYQDFHDYSTLSLFHDNDAVIHYDHRLELPVPAIFPSSVDVPNNDCFKYVTKSDLYQSRACSVSLERTQTLIDEVTPFYIRYLQEQNKMSKWLSRQSKSQQFGQKTRFSRFEKHILHSSMNPLNNPKKLQKMDNHVDRTSSVVSTEIIPKEIDYINLMHNEDINVPVKLTKDSMNDIEKRNQIQIIIDQIPNEMSHSSIQQSLIQDEMSQIQPQSNEKRVISSRISDYSNQIQVGCNQVPIQSGQQSIIRNSGDRNISNVESVNKAQGSEFSKTTINLTTFTKKESQSSTQKNTSDTYKTSSTTDHYISPNSPFIPSLPLFLNSEEQPKLLDKKMFRISNTHLHIRTNDQKILVFTGDNDDLFNRILENLSKLIPPDTLTVSHLSHEAFCKHPWIGQNTACLIIANTSHLDDKCWIRLQQYFSNSGKILFLCQNKLLASLSACENSKKTAKLLKMAFGERQSKKLGKDFEYFLKKTLKKLHKDKMVNQTFHAKDLVGDYKYSVVVYKTKDSPLLLYMENAEQHASALFSDATSEQLLHSGSTLIADALSRLSIEITMDVTIPSLTSGYFICEYDRMPWDMEGMHFNEPFGSMPKLLLKQVKKHGPLPEVSSKLLPIEVRTRTEHLPDFNDEIYFKRLETPRLGKALFYFPVCESTMDIGKSLAFAMAEEPIVVVARQQTKGVGRSGNQWLSPVGCAMFTFNYMLLPESSLNNNVSIIQHIFCVAIISGIRSLRKDLKNFPLKIKWPNDIYYGRMYKVGGLIVNATSLNKKTVCVLGAGLNLSNSKPTVCINDFFPINLKIRQEDYIANTLNKFQYYINLYEKKGVDAFLKHYYRFWLHSREKVTLSDTKEKVVILGLDQHGFLKVRSCQSGEIMVVHPDGNTFDMMKGLISAKYPETEL